MTDSEQHTRSCKSPKRKRDVLESLQYSPVVFPSVARLVTDFREYPFPKPEDNIESAGDGSPRSAVVGQMQDLDLQGTFSQSTSPTHDGLARKRWAGMKLEEDTETTGHTQENMHAQTPPSGEGQGTTNPAPHLSNIHLDSNASIPFTQISEKPSLHSRSPPLDCHLGNPLFWHDSEITGHNPTDPDDDGYGINSIGFKPTVAVAWARSQRRKQQLADYKNREAREARQRRSDRRRFDSTDSQIAVSEETSKKNVRVRFVNE